MNRTFNWLCVSVLAGAFATPAMAAPGRRARPQREQTLVQPDRRATDQVAPGAQQRLRLRDGSCLQRQDQPARFGQGWRCRAGQNGGGWQGGLGRGYGRGLGGGFGPGFIDRDNDGICDRLQNR